MKSRLRVTNPPVSHEYKHDDQHHSHGSQELVIRFWACVILTLPIVALSDLALMLFGWQAPTGPLSHFLVASLSSIIFFYGGSVFILGAWRELRARLPGMMTLITLAIATSYFYSLYADLTQTGHTLYWELSTLITIMLLGHWLEFAALNQANNALGELAKLLPDTAERVSGSSLETVPLDVLQVGDELLIRPGSAVPSDGVVVEGRSEINESIVTGESKPVAKTIGAAVLAGSLNGDGSLRIRVSKVGSQTFLSGVRRLVADAQASKSRLQILSDRAAYYLTLVAISSGVTTFIAWRVSGASIATASEYLVAVLVVACPHALGLAVPMVASMATRMAASSGLLVRQRLALESARKIDMILFDKTGTLTQGRFGVAEIVAVEGGESEVLRLAASVNQHSEHPIGRAILAEAQKSSVLLAPILEFRRLPGVGAEAKIGGELIRVGSSDLIEGKASVPPEIAKNIKVFMAQGKTVSFIFRSGDLVGLIALNDLVRAESRTAVKHLRSLGYKVAMVTGDSQEVAEWTAKELGMDQFFAKVLPDEKAELVRTLQKDGLQVAMVGDGVNDAPALATADLGIAVGAGTNVAIESAGIILVRDDPRDIAKIFTLSRLAYRVMIQNLIWAAGYNVISIPLAAGILASRGVELQPALAAVVMSVSTIIVTFNTLLMRRSSLV